MQTFLYLFITTQHWPISVTINGLYIIHYAWYRSHDTRQECPGSQLLLMVTAFLSLEVLESVSLIATMAFPDNKAGRTNLLFQYD